MNKINIINDLIDNHRLCNNTYAYSNNFCWPFIFVAVHNANLDFLLVVICSRKWSKPPSWTPRPLGKCFDFNTKLPNMKTISWCTACAVHFFFNLPPINQISGEKAIEEFISCSCDLLPCLIQVFLFLVFSFGSYPASSSEEFSKQLPSYGSLVSLHCDSPGKRLLRSSKFLYSHSFRMPNDVAITELFEGVGQS